MSFEAGMKLNAAGLWSSRYY